MPFPAARDPLQNVDSQREQGSRTVARTHTKIRGRIWWGPGVRRTLCELSNEHVQRGNLSAIPCSIDTPQAQGENNRGYSGQRLVAQEPGIAALARSSQGHHQARLPASVQPRLKRHRARMEADPALANTQQILQDLG